jgi:hypothetical protein
MFAKLVQFRLLGIGRAQQALVAGGSQTDKHAGCGPIAQSHRDRRPTLVCRWQKAPVTGALECAWSIAAPATGESRPRRSLGHLQRSTDARVPAKRPVTRAAA